MEVFSSNLGTLKTRFTSSKGKEKELDRLVS
jgi:hypothetical protein